MALTSVTFVFFLLFLAVWGEGCYDMMMIFYLRVNKTIRRLLKKDWSGFGTISLRNGLLKIVILAFFSQMGHLGSFLTVPFCRESSKIGDFGLLNIIFK